jgi:hypothetical protein
MQSMLEPCGRSNLSSGWTSGPASKIWEPSIQSLKEPISDRTRIQMDKSISMIELCLPLSLPHVRPGPPDV